MSGPRLEGWAVVGGGNASTRSDRRWLVGLLQNDADSAVCAPWPEFLQFAFTRKDQSVAGLSLSPYPLLTVVSVMVF